MRISVAAAIVCLSAIGISTASDVEAAIKTTTNIPAQGLGPALQALAQERGFELLYLSDLVDSLNTRGATGDLTTDEALQKLLSGTGLTYRYLDENTVTVLALSSTSSAGTPSSAFDPATHALSTPQAIINPNTPDSGTAKKGKKGWFERFRLAQNDQSSSPTTSDSGEQEENSPQKSDKSSESRVIDEVIVTGSHIRGVENNTVPLIVLGKAYIDSTGYSTATQLIESLPQNFALGSQSGIGVPGNAADAHQGSSVNLRGIGQGTTLVLLNGRRMAPGYFGQAVDISTLPLSAVERVEVLTDGASALYGSDAIGGVINFVTRSDFAGAETRLRSGWADGGLNEYRVDQALGTNWSSGNALLSLGYYKRDMLLAKDRDWVPNGSLLGSLLPQDESYSVLFSGQQQLSSTLELFAEVLYTQRDSRNFGGRTVTFSIDRDVDNSQLTSTVGAQWQVGGDWQIEAAGSYARNKLETTSISATTASLANPLSEIEASQVKADGSILVLPGGKVSLAVGAEWRVESFQRAGRNLLTGALSRESEDVDQIIRSAFVELYVPIVGAGNAMAGARRLEMSVAGRFDDYSNAGSSFDPQVGLMWEPVEGLRLRANRGTSYKAPNFIDYNTAGNSTIASFIANAGGIPFPGFPVPFQVMSVNGASPAMLSSQESRNLSFGVEFAPASAQGLRLGLNYYRIEYADRIATPAGSLALFLNDPSGYGVLTTRDPSVAQVNAAIASGLLGFGFLAFNPNFTPNTNFNPDSVDVIVDLRKRNLSVTHTEGVDVSMEYRFNVAGADVNFGLAATHIAELTQQVTAASIARDTVDTIFNPADWRVRGSFGWQRQGWAANLFVNYTDAYVRDRLAAPFVPISSYTTVDARLAYDFVDRFNGLLSGTRISVSAQNLFDRDPPSTRALVTGLFDMGFDPTNASPLGRFFAIELTKAW